MKITFQSSQLVPLIIAYELDANFSKYVHAFNLRIIKILFVFQNEMDKYREFYYVFLQT